MIDRTHDLRRVREALRRSRVVTLLGPRQCGKTTLARQFVAADSLNYFDLEEPAGLARLDQPDTALRPLRGLVVIDEVQRRPELFPLLRVPAEPNSICCYSNRAGGLESSASVRMPPR
jgi:predicted AAA+ superfamily ATPase